MLQRNHLIIAPRNTHASSPSLRSSTSTSSRRQSLPSMNNASNSNYKGEEDVIGADISPLSSFRNKSRRSSGSHAASKQSTRTSAVNSAEVESSKFQDVSLTWDYVDIQVRKAKRRCVFRILYPCCNIATTMLIPYTPLFNHDSLPLRLLLWMSAVIFFNPIIS